MTPVMSADARALLLRTKGDGLMRSPLVFDVLRTLEYDMQQAAKGKTVSIPDWSNWLKKGEPQRSAFIQALFLLVAAGGHSAATVRDLRLQLQSVTPSRRRAAKVLHQPAERQAQGLFREPQRKESGSADRL